MRKSLVPLAFLTLLTACAGAPRASAAAAEDCRMVAQDNSDSHIKVRHECSSAADPAPQPGPTQS